MATVRLGDWEFLISEEPGTSAVSVPDCGGMADSLPRVPEQLAWAERVFAELPALKQVWPTTWEFRSEALPELRALFESHGARWDEV